MCDCVVFGIWIVCVIGWLEMYLECCEYVLCVCVEYVVGWYVVVVVCEFEL